MSDTIRILLVEDNEADAAAILQEFHRADYEIYHERVERVQDAILAVKEKPWDLVICDYYVVNGTAETILDELDKLDSDLPVVIMTGKPLSMAEEQQGVKVYKHAIVSKGRLSRLISVIEREMRLTKSYDDTLASWAKAIEIRDKDTSGHSERVVELSMSLARKIGMNEIDIVHLRRGALLHDVGKTVISDTILLKPSRLDKMEMNEMRRHPEIAHQFLQPIEFLLPALDIPYCHHERWDGKGYPRGLKGEDIPLSARLFTIVDVYDALVNDRPYRKAWSKAKTVAYLKKNRGTQFDPEIVDTFITMIGETNAT